MADSLKWVQLQTAVNELGQSQGDRLCERKAKAQHHLQRTAAAPSQIVQPLLKAPLISLEGDSVPTTPTKTAPPPTCRYSSDTTPIKQMRLSSTKAPPPGSSVFKTSSAPKPFPAFRNLNFSQRAVVKSTIEEILHCRSL